MVTLLTILSGLGGLGWVAWLLYCWDNEWKPIRQVRSFIILGASALSLFMFMVFAAGGATQVPATQIAVIENQWAGTFYTLGPGTHIWPFARLAPFITKITKYDLRWQTIEIGGPNLKGGEGVQADSSSPGRPVVYFWARGWCQPNIAKIVDLHRLRGPNYADDWVEKNMTSALKSVQGQNTYDYVGQHRLDMAGEVEDALQKELVDIDERPLVIVKQLAIVDFAFEDIIDQFLTDVAQKEFERQRAVQDIMINEQQQKSRTIAVSTEKIETETRADAERYKREQEATGQANAQMLLADAAAYEIKVRYEAESNGIRQVQAAMANSPEYLTYQKQNRWNGILPNILVAGENSMLPLLNLVP